MWRHLVSKFLANASGATWWPSFQLIQVVPIGGRFFLMQVAPFGGCISDKCIWRQLFTKFVSYKVPPVMVSTHGSVVPLAMFKPKSLSCHTLSFECVVISVVLSATVHWGEVGGWREYWLFCENFRELLKLYLITRAAAANLKCRKKTPPKTPHQ